jgi:hypothetical protein
MPREIGLGTRILGLCRSTSMPSRPSLKDPHRAALIGVIEDLNSIGDTFLVVHPHIADGDWFVSVSKQVGTFGGFEVHRP